MKLWIPGDPCITGDAAAIYDEARERAAGASHGWGQPYTSGGLAVRFRFVHKLAPGLTTAPLLPVEPNLLELVTVWAEAVESILWRDWSQVVQVYARREWGNVDGVEVSL